MALYSYVYERPARKHFRWWHNWAVRSRLQPMIEVARMLKRRFENIITYLRHRITNAASESINAKIQWVKYTARGFRNKQNFVHAIYFHCGGLDMAKGWLTGRACPIHARLGCQAKWELPFCWRLLAMWSSRTCRRSRCMLSTFHGPLREGPRSSANCLKFRRHCGGSPHSL
jgi:hypothetical protein